MILTSDRTIIDNIAYYLTMENAQYFIFEEGKQLNKIESNQLKNAFSETLMAKYHGLNFIVAAYPNDEFISLFTNDSLIAKELGFKMMFGPMEYYLELSPSSLEEIYWQREKSSFPFPYPEGLPEREVIFPNK